MTAAKTKTADNSTEVNIKNRKKQIEALRKQLKNPAVLRNADQTQTIYDQIEELKRDIEQLTRETRKAVPIADAPIVGQRQVSKRKRGFNIY